MRRLLTAHEKGTGNSEEPVEYVVRQADGGTAVGAYLPARAAE